MAEHVNIKYVEWHDAVDENDTSYGTKYFVDNEFIEEYNKTWYDTENTLAI